VGAEKEDEMPATPSLTCSLCGLRFANGSVLELHIRQDHVHKEPRAASGRSGAGDSGTGQPRPEAPPAEPPSPSGEGHDREAAGTANPKASTRSRRYSLTSAARASRRAIRVLRQLNSEVLSASEAIFRSGRFPPTGTGSQPGSGEGKHGNQAA
jgi:hypothetical protein